MAYQERSTDVAGVVLWQRGQTTAPERTQIMPDGCLDLIWDGSCLFVAGPDTAARWHQSATSRTYVGLRFSGGLGSALLDVPADELRDRRLSLSELWPARQVRTLTERVTLEPAAVLESWVVERGACCEPDPLGARMLAMAEAGMPVAVMADRLDMSARQLHRRCLPAFGYGPRHLSRVLRFGRVLALIRRGRSLARVAADCGYADQAHLSREVRALAATTPSALGNPV